MDQGHETKFLIFAPGSVNAVIRDAEVKASPAMLLEVGGRRMNVGQI